MRAQLDPIKITSVRPIEHVFFLFVIASTNIDSMYNLTRDEKSSVDVSCQSLSSSFGSVGESLHDKTLSHVCDNIALQLTCRV